MVRIEHAVWCERSVTEIRKGVKKKVTDGGNADEALKWVAAHGIADPDCTPYSTDDRPLMFPADRTGRTVRIPAHVRIPNDAARPGRLEEFVRPCLARIEERVRLHPENSNDYFFWDDPEASEVGAGRVSGRV